MEKLHELTVDDYRRAESGPRQDLKCPVCGSMKTEITAQDTHDGRTLVHQGTLTYPVGMSAAPVGPWLVPVTCTNCGYVMMFNSRILFRDINE